MATKAQILLHLVGWNLEQDELELSPNVVLHNGKDSEVIKAYQKFCLETGYDDGEPFAYTAYIELPFESDVDNNPRSTSALVLNLLTIILGEPLHFSLYLQIGSINDSRSVLAFRLSENPLDDYWLDHGANLSLGNNEAEKLITIYNNLMANKSSAIIRNALDYYYQSWNATIAEQLCINASITIESLFSPSANSELSFRIALNFALFFNDSGFGDKRRVFGLIKKFYSARSKLVHGERIKESDWDVISETFRILNAALSKILYDKDMLATFSTKKIREEYFSDLLFEGAK